MFWLVCQIIRAVGNPAKVTLSGENVIALDGVSTYSGTVAALRINTDGTIDKGTAIDGNAISYSQIDSATDWIIPNSAASSTYEVRVTAVTGTFSSAAAADDTWIAISTAREWQRDTADVVGVDTVNFTFEIRLGSSGAALDSGTYELKAENTV